MSSPREALAAADARLRAGDAAGARAALSRLLDVRAVPAELRIAALKLRSRAHEAARDLGAAAADLRTAAALAPRDARVRNELGIVLADAGDAEGAVRALREAVVLDPRYARAWNNLGNALRGAGRHGEARDAFAQAVAVDDRYLLAWTNLAVALRDQGDAAGAVRALERALALEPGDTVALVTLASLRHEQGDLDAAIALLTRALQRRPADATALLMLGEAHAERDELDAARSAWRAAHARDPGLLRAVIGERLVLPMVPADGAAIAHARRQFAAGLAALEQELPVRAAGMTPARVHDELRWTNFPLAYHGEDDLALQSYYGDLVTGLLARAGTAMTTAGTFAPVSSPATRRAGSAATPRLRVGFVSAFLRDGTAGRYFESWITDLPRERFEVHVFVLNATQDALTQRIAARADAWHDVARRKPAEIASLIDRERLDALVYPELGMHAGAFALAAARLTPLQCAGWGHPVTTGLPTIDAYFSSAAMEPADAARHYRERLVALPGLGTRYAMPVPPADSHRAAFGLPEDATLLLCPQSLFKIHPDNDVLLARVLAQAPHAHLVVFRGRHPALTGAWLGRLERACRAVDAGAQGRVHILAHAAHEDYLRINRVCDVMLDTLHWSGGNTSLDAIACGLPIVTLPGRFMRGRQSEGMLQLMGITDTIAADADDYVRIAARLAHAPAERIRLRQRIEAARHVLFDDPAPVAAFAQALEALARASARHGAMSATPLATP
jgi:CRISPR-associated protein Csy1